MATRTGGKNANFKAAYSKEPAYERVYSPLKTHGGKYYQVNDHSKLMPPRDSYDTLIEACAGGATFLLAHDPTGKAEILNDLDGVVTNFWDVLQDKTKFELLRELLTKTPFSQVEFNRACSLLRLNGPATIDSVHLARAVFVVARQSRQALGKDFATVTKNRLRRNMNEQVSAWLTAIDGLVLVHDRLQRVRIENKHVTKLLKTWRNVERALVYIDSPYHPSTRVANGVYRVEMTADEHVDMLKELSLAKYKFMLCGYSCPVYEEYATKNKWRRATRAIDNKASGAKVKEIKNEVVWMNY